MFQDQGEDAHRATLVACSCCFFHLLLCVVFVTANREIVNRNKLLGIRKVNERLDSLDPDLLQKICYQERVRRIGNVGK